ncbi:DUF4822 domain-containing protein [Gordonia neofelifaecis]|uniref:DUF4822 domain-containing protein n=1 Tax=Gordonia neofelifaecis NRRL B-59395 TaxID=644548 RepID=F1YGX8_9ACTN|nr:DUF4822 domain-containing protein [Gordonia neofelifaecis]EGD56276.1 hypothetical protein SCNU_05481 [Gordonia neofelifaecis NRRL B-59395]
MTRTTITRRAALAVLSVSAAAGAVLAAGQVSAAPASATPIESIISRFTDTLTPSQTLASTPWKTTGAVDQDGKRVALDNPGVSNFVGWAYFDADGTYTMYNLDDSPKLKGDWTVNADGSERWINAKDDSGKVLFERVVPIVELNKNVFTYRVYPNAADHSTYFDIVHTKTNHAEPGSDYKGPGAKGNQGGQGKGGYHYNNGNSH